MKYRDGIESRAWAIRFAKPVTRSTRITQAVAIRNYSTRRIQMRTIVLALGLAVTVGVVAEHDAQATPITQACTVSFVESFSALTETPNQGAGLIVQCAETPGVSYWMYTTTGAGGSACATLNTDIVKMTESVAVSMRLSGKAGKVYYNNAIAPCTQNLFEGLSF